MLPLQIPGCAAGIRELTQRLQERGTAVYLVSGGFRSIINPIADMLNIPRDHVYANTILYKVCCLHSCLSVTLLVDCQQKAASSVQDV